MLAYPKGGNLSAALLLLGLDCAPIVDGLSRLSISGISTQSLPSKCTLDLKAEYCDKTH